MAARRDGEREEDERVSQISDFGVFKDGDAGQKWTSRIGGEEEANKKKRTK